MGSTCSRNCEFVSTWCVNLNFTFDGYNLQEISKAYGPRPGEYTVDPNYVRTGMANKPYFWDAYRKKWELIRLGDTFFMDEDGVPRKTGMRTSGTKNW